VIYRTVLQFAAANIARAAIRTFSTSVFEEAFKICSTLGVATACIEPSGPERKMSSRRLNSLHSDEEGENGSYKIGDEVQGLITMLESDEIVRRGVGRPQSSRLVDDPDELLATVAESKPKHRTFLDIDFSRYFWNFMILATVMVWVAVIFVWVS
jgi:hypothetical protein